MFAAMVVFALPYSYLITGGTIVDGTGGKPFKADLRVQGNRIIEIGTELVPHVGEDIVDARNLVVAPGFIDAHSHADSRIDEDPLAESQISQGITTAVVGQDGGWRQPVKDALATINTIKPAINFAYFSGHGGVRSQVLGEDFKRPATENEIVQMNNLVSEDMKNGALGLSSGLEYDPGYYSLKSELIAIAKSAKVNGGLYISHLRDEGDNTFTAIDELKSISKDAQIPAQISHIKLGTSAVWGKAKEAAKETQVPQITADVYPYTYWQSTIAALSPSRNWTDRKIWVKALKDVGGPQNIRLTRFTPDSTWQGKTLEELSHFTKKDPVVLIQEILDRTKDGKGSQSVVVTAMKESDLEVFIKSPRIMFCSDGSIGGSHPRGAGSFPRILGRYVRERKVLTLAEAIRKMTSLTAVTFGLKERGKLKSNYIADIAIFDPKTIIDHATPTEPTKRSTGVVHVFVGGQLAFSNGQSTGLRNGQGIRKNH